MVDDERQVLRAVERDLRGHFRDEYRFIAAESGAEALVATRELKKRNDAVALFLVDQRMPEMTGTDFLAQAQELYPDARKVLLTAYADTSAAIDSINDIGLDQYLMKPWHPPEEHLYPILDDLLDDWHASVDVPYDGIRVAGTLWSAKAHHIKDFLSRNRIPYQWLDTDKDDTARSLVESLPDADDGRPVVFFPDGTTLVGPEDQELASQIGLQTSASQPFYELIILGGGPAGLGAAVYAASEGLSVTMIEKEATGGQAGTSSRIENYLGFPKGVSGADLARRATDQAIRFGTEIITAEATSVRVEQPYKYVTLSDGAELSCKALLVATGMAVRRLEVPGADRLAGAGLYYGAALAEAANFRGEDVFIVGGANSAGQGAMLYARFAGSVTLLIRSSSLETSMSSYLIDQLADTDNVAVRTRTVVREVHGERMLEGLTLSGGDDEQTEFVAASALCVFIGQRPHSDIVKGLVEITPAGHILTGLDLIKGGKRPPGWRLKRDPLFVETSVPGIFAAGDVRHGSMARVASAVGSGAVAVSLIHKYLSTI